VKSASSGRTSNALHKRKKIVELRVDFIYVPTAWAASKQ